MNNDQPDRVNVVENAFDYNIGVAPFIDNTGTLVYSSASFPKAGSSNTGQIGITDASNAPAGKVGEYLSSKPIGSTAVELANGTPQDITTLPLTAGDWQCTGSAWTNPAGSTTTSLFEGGISTTPNAMPTAPNGNGMFQEGAAIAAGGAEGFSFGPVRENVAAATTLYLVARQIFDGGASYANGFIGCLRVR